MLAGPSLLTRLSMNNTVALCRSLALHVPTASSTRCSQRSRKPPYTKERRTQESIAPNKLRVATLGSQQQTKETCLTLSLRLAHVDPVTVGKVAIGFLQRTIGPPSRASIFSDCCICASMCRALFRTFTSQKLQCFRHALEV